MSNRPRIIALYSPVPQQGKSTVAKVIAQRSGWVRLSFATPVKRLVGSLLTSAGIGESSLSVWLDGRMKETVVPILGHSPRQLMQVMGTDCVRDLIGEDVWVELLMMELRKFRQSGLSVVIDDMRLPNEYDALYAEHALMVKVTGRPAPHIDPDTVKHRSEGQLGGPHYPFDIVIHNDGTLADLEAAAKSL